jgi:hypothetical protein
VEGRAPTWMTGAGSPARTWYAAVSVSKEKEKPLKGDVGSGDARRGSRWETTIRLGEMSAVD